MNAWEEALHPRDKKGEFTHGQGWVGRLSDRMGGESRFDIGYAPGSDYVTPRAEVAGAIAGDGKLDLSGEEQAAIRSYTGEQFTNVNRTLREGKENGISKLLDAVFARVPGSKHEISVMRTVRHDVGEELFGPSGSKIGKEFSDLGFISTSFHNRVSGDEKYKVSAKKFPAVIHIKIPAGTKALRPWKYGRYKDKEGEVILPRGTRFKVSGDFVDEKGFRRIQVEVVPG